MANLIYLAGEYANILNGAESITPDNEDTLYPKENLYDGLPSKPFRFNALAGDLENRIDIDANKVLNGDMEDWTAGTSALPDNWSEDPSYPPDSVDRESSIVDEGTYSCRLTGATSNVKIYQDIEVLAGWDMTCHGSVYCGPTTMSASISIQNLQTGRFLTSGGTWSASAAAIVSTSAQSWSQSGNIAFTVEGFATTGTSQCTLRIRCDHSFASGGNYSYYDDIAVWPHVNFASIHGHNLMATVVPKIYYDDNASYSSPTLGGTFTWGQPAIYIKLGSTITNRYLRLELYNLPYEAQADPWEIGEFVLGQYKTLGRNFRRHPGYSIDSIRPQTRFRNEASGQIYAANLSEHARQVLRFEYQALTASQRDEIVNEWYSASSYGQHPIIVVPFDDEATIIHGRVGPSIEYQRTGIGELTNFSVEVFEDPFSISVS